MDWLILIAATLIAQTLPTAPQDRWVDVLAGFDLIRSQAFEHADRDLLRRVYPDGSELLGEDRALLDSYAARGVAIEDMRMRVVTARLVDRTRDSVELDVVDQLSLTRVRMPDGVIRDLPRDQPTRRIIELTLTPQGWRISSVSPRP